MEGKIMKKQILLAMLSIFMINTQCMWQKALDYTKKQGGNIGLIGVGATIMATALYLEYQHKQTDKNNKLFDAIRENNLEKTRAALKDGADVSAYCNGYDDEFINCGKQPIIVAANYDSSLDIIKLLVENKANIHATDKSGNTILHFIKGNIKHNANGPNINAISIINYLIDKGLSPAIQNNSGEFPYYMKFNSDVGKHLKDAFLRKRSFEYVKTNNLDALKEFWTVHYDCFFDVYKATWSRYCIRDFINAQDKSGKTFLHWAVINNNFEMIKYLCTFDPNLTIRSNAGGTALEYANNLAIENYLEQQVVQQELNKQLWKAIDNKDLVGVKGAVSLGANVNVIRQRRENPLTIIRENPIYAARNNQEIKLYLAGKGASLEELLGIFDISRDGPFFNLRYLNEL